MALDLYRLILDIENLIFANLEIECQLMKLISNCQVISKLGSIHVLYIDDESMKNWFPTPPMFEFSPLLTISFTQINTDTTILPKQKTYLYY